MGKRRYAKTDVSKQRSDALGIPSLLVLERESNENTISVVHKRYFKGEKLACPACGSLKTRCSKVIKRKLKDIVYKDDADFRTIDIVFYQRYMRCDGCNESVFPEEIDFADKGCKYTNRLADVLAEGTLRQSYNKVCARYGVPASTASVGDIMRRRIKSREASLPAIAPPSTLSIVEVPFYSAKYPVVLALQAEKVFCLDILPDASEETYGAFFRKLATGGVTTFYIDPSESLRTAIDTHFPEANVMVTGECIERYARNALLEIIETDGKRFPIVHKKDRLTLPEKNLISDYDKKRIQDGLQSRPRLKAAYEKYQQLLRLLDQEWTYEELRAWASSLPGDLDEFDDLRIIVDLNMSEIDAHLSGEKPSTGYTTAISAICRSIEEMPHCIFDVLRARCMLTIEHDTEDKDGNITRLGIEATRFTENLNEIARSIRKIRDPYSD